MTGKRILVVDDEQQLVHAIKINLQSAGFAVLEAYDGEEALRLAQEHMPDLIVLDVMLPKMDGYWVCSLLKRDTRYQAMPIILFSARSQPEDIELGARVGAQAYLVKPVEPQQLISKINEILQA